MTYEQKIDIYIEEIKRLMVSKEKEYADGNNPFKNFIEAKGFFKNGTEKLALWNYLVKHLVSLKGHCEGTQVLTPEQLKEKTMDTVIYSVLLNFMDETINPK